MCDQFAQKRGKSSCSKAQKHQEVQASAKEQQFKSKGDTLTTDIHVAIDNCNGRFALLLVFVALRLGLLPDKKIIGSPSDSVCHWKVINSSLMMGEGGAFIGKPLLFTQIQKRILCQ